MKIEVLGTGCPSCRKLEENVREAVKEMDIEAEIVKVDDMKSIAASGVMLTPALILDGEMKLSGGVPSKEKIMEILKDNE